MLKNAQKINHSKRYRTNILQHTAVASFSLVIFKLQNTLDLFLKYSPENLQLKLNSSFEETIKCLNF